MKGSWLSIAAPDCEYSRVAMRGKSSNDHHQHTQLHVLAQFRAVVYSDCSSVYKCSRPNARATATELVNSNTLQACSLCNLELYVCDVSSASFSSQHSHTTMSTLLASKLYTHTALLASTYYILHITSAACINKHTVHSMYAMHCFAAATTSVYQKFAAATTAPYNRYHR
eukprot:17803-Heterococcus_DN1.PRE.8